jgi:hypothetical protein
MAEEWLRTQSISMWVYYEIMEQIIRQLVFDQLAVGKHLLQDLCAVGRPPTPSHPHTHACLVMREKHFLCACEERGFRRTKGREQSERWREKKWISTHPLKHSSGSEKISLRIR